jgi:hypothetical protein
MTNLKAGDPCPDPDVLRLDDATARLSALRGPGRTALVFVRHFG